MSAATANTNMAASPRVSRLTLSARARATSFVLDKLERDHRLSMSPSFKAALFDELEAAFEEVEEEVVNTYEDAEDDDVRIDASLVEEVLDEKRTEMKSLVSSAISAHVRVLHEWVEAWRGGESRFEKLGDGLKLQLSSVVDAAFESMTNRLRERA